MGNLGCCVGANGQSVPNVVDTPYTNVGVNECKQLCADNSACGAINVVANRNANNNGWLNGDCYLLEWWPVTTGNDDNENCRCWMRDRDNGRERRAVLGRGDDYSVHVTDADSADVVVGGGHAAVTSNSTLRGRKY